jgi:hypothetical protein
MIHNKILAIPRYMMAVILLVNFISLNSKVLAIAKQGINDSSSVFIPQLTPSSANRYLKPIYSGPHQVFDRTDNEPKDDSKPVGWPEYGYSMVRNPAVILAANGNIVIVAEGRLSPGPIADSGSVDLISRYSVDNGYTWSPTKIVSSIQSSLPDEKRDTHAHHALVTAPNGDILLVYSVERWGTRKQGRCYLRRSKDNGLTWSEPEDISYLIPFVDKTNKDWDDSYMISNNWDGELKGGLPSNRKNGSDLKKGDYIIKTNGDRWEYTGTQWKLCVNWFSWGAGNGIVHSDGAIVFVVAIERRAAVMRSVDNGKSWTIGPRTEQIIFEADPVELSNGNIMAIGRNFSYMVASKGAVSPFVESMELRYCDQYDPDMNHWFKDSGGKHFMADSALKFRGPNLKRVAVFSSDGTKIKSVYDHTALIEPISNCSAINVTESPDPHIIAFANPAPSSDNMRFTHHKGFLARDKQRAPYTIRLSFDDGKTWPIQKIVPDAQNQSKMVALPNSQIGIVTEYAPGQDGYGVQFVRLSLGWIYLYDPIK